MHKMVKCFECHNPMVSTQETFNYNFDNVSNIKLMSVEIRRCSACSSYEVVIPEMNKLHSAISLIVNACESTKDEICLFFGDKGWQSY